MNRSLPSRDRDRGSAASRGASRIARIVPGAGGLVGGTAAAADEPTIGPRCATGGPRSPRQSAVVVSGSAVVTAARQADDPTIRPMVFTGIKHGGFARFWRETLCAFRGSRNKRLCF
jgi:hypothetical protein